MWDSILNSYLSHKLFTIKSFWKKWFLMLILMLSRFDTIMINYHRVFGYSLDHVPSFAMLAQESFRNIGGLLIFYFCIQLLVFSFYNQISFSHVIFIQRFVVCNYVLPKILHTRWVLACISCTMFEYFIHFHKKLIVTLFY